MITTYLHKRLDGAVFYVGAGSEGRPYSTRRGTRWKQAASEGHTVEICAQWNTPEEAREHEAFLIEHFLELNHPLINQRKGGGGMVGLKHTTATLAKMSEVQSGENHPMYGRRGDLSPVYGKKGELHPAWGCKHSQESKDQCSLAQLGEKNHMWGKTQTEESNKKRSLALKGKTIPAEVVAKRSGENHPNFGKPHPPETVTKNSESNRVRYYCLECGYENVVGQVGKHCKLTGHKDRIKVEQNALG